MATFTEEEIQELFDTVERVAESMNPSGLGRTSEPDDLATIPQQLVVTRLTDSSTEVPSE